MIVCTECNCKQKEILTMKDFMSGFVKYVTKDFWKEWKEDWATLKEELKRKNVPAE
jgi:hypothetical protein